MRDGSVSSEGVQCREGEPTGTMGNVRVLLVSACAGLPLWCDVSSVCAPRATYSSRVIARDSPRAHSWITSTNLRDEQRVSTNGNFRRVDAEHLARDNRRLQRLLKDTDSGGFQAFSLGEGSGKEGRAGKARRAAAGEVAEPPHRAPARGPPYWASRALRIRSGADAA